MGDPIVGYAPGAYDLFHVGHLNVLRQAREHCDVLVAGVVADEVLRADQGRAAVRAARGAARDRGRASASSTRCTPRPRRTSSTPGRTCGFHRIFKGDDWRGTAKGRRARGAARRASASRSSTSPTRCTPPARSCAGRVRRTRPRPPSRPSRARLMTHPPTGRRRGRRRRPGLTLPAAAGVRHRRLRRSLRVVVPPATATAARAARAGRRLAGLRCAPHLRGRTRLHRRRARHRPHVRRPRGRRSATAARTGSRVVDRARPPARGEQGRQPDPGVRRDRRRRPRARSCRAPRGCSTTCASAGGVEAFLNYGCLLGAVRDGPDDRHRLRRRRLLPQRADPPGRRDPRVLPARARDAAPRLAHRADVRRRLQGAAPARRRPHLLRRRVRGVLRRRHFYQLGNRSGAAAARGASCPPRRSCSRASSCPAPADPEAMLAFVYGPRLAGAGPVVPASPTRPAGCAGSTAGCAATATSCRRWNAFYRSPDAPPVPRRRSAFARWVDAPDAARATRSPTSAAGTGRDAAFFARRGHRCAPTTCSPDARGPDPAAAAPQAARRHDVRRLMLNELRTVAVTGAEIGSCAAAAPLRAAAARLRRRRGPPQPVAAGPDGRRRGLPRVRLRHGPDRPTCRACSGHWTPTRSSPSAATAAGGRLLEREDTDGTDLNDRPGLPVTRLQVDFTEHHDESHLSDGSAGARSAPAWPRSRPRCRRSASCSAGWPSSPTW